MVSSLGDGDPTYDVAFASGIGACWSCVCCPGIWRGSSRSSIRAIRTGGTTAPTEVARSCYTGLSLPHDDVSRDSPFRVGARNQMAHAPPATSRRDAVL